MTDYSYRAYSSLATIEYFAIIEYMDYKNPNVLEDLILSIKEMSPGMRRFIADLVSGKLKRDPGKKPSTNRRDRSICKGIFYLLRAGHKLHSNSSREGAAAIMAGRFNIEEDAALKVYSKLKAEEESIMQPGLDDVSWYFQNFPAPQ